MQYKKLWFSVSIKIVLAIARPVSSVYESDNYIITKTTLSSGGSYMDSNNFSVTATIGQTSCIGMSSRGSTVFHAGFWTPEFYEMYPKALPFIPLLLLDD